MKTNNSFLSIFASISLLLAFLLPSCSGESLTIIYHAIQKDGVSYDLDNDQHEASARGFYVDNGKYVSDLILPDYVEAGNEEFNVVKIADRAFAGYPYASVTIGCNVRSIGNQAFATCSDIETVKLQGKILPLLPENAFDQTIYDNARLIVLPGVDVNGTGWEKFANVSDKRAAF